MKMFSRSKDSRGIGGRSIMNFDDFQYKAVNELFFNLNDVKNDEESVEEDSSGKEDAKNDKEDKYDKDGSEKSTDAKI